MKCTVLFHCTIHLIVYYNLYILLTYCPLLEDGGGGVDTGGGPWVLRHEVVATFDVTVAVGVLFLRFIHWGGCRLRYIRHS